MLCRYVAESRLNGTLRALELLFNLCNLRFLAITEWVILNEFQEDRILLFGPPFVVTGWTRWFGDSVGLDHEIGMWKS